jgi:hypothetical protein
VAVEAHSAAWAACLVVAANEEAVPAASPSEHRPSSDSKIPFTAWTNLFWSSISVPIPV